MLRGKTTYMCDTCGNIFEGLDIEDNATVGTMPMRCPKCGAKCLPMKGGWLSSLKLKWAEHMDDGNHAIYGE